MTNKLDTGSDHHSIAPLVLNPTPIVTTACHMYYQGLLAGNTRYAYGQTPSLASKLLLG